MSRIARSTVDEIHRRLDAISVVEGYIRLEKRGGRYWGRCPFHGGGQERTPSLTVDPDKKLYHCFGCGKGGSILDFVMEMDKTDYPET
ncbi:MAG: CHC2 zinc finger domain-containing protein, partial [Treponema sp.]|nr:CHC2 zinc finger domain-containing protein [Treponema sp.]